MADQTSSWINALRGIDPAEAMPFGAAATPEGSPTALSGMIAGAAKLIPNAMKASAIDVQNLGSGEPTVGPAFEAARMLAGSGMPAAEQNAAGIFGGRLAKTADPKAFSKAELMAEMGYHPKDVIAATGLHRSPADHLWRSEISDHAASLKYMPTGEGDRAMGSVASLLDHPEFAKAYPEFQNYRLSLTKDSSSPTGSGQFDHIDKTFHVNAPNESVARSVALHELQHGVQGIEGFSAGNNPQWYGYQIAEGLKKNPDLLQGNNARNVINQANKIYRNTAGEVEARNVQTRGNFIPSTRASQMPWETQDVPYINQFHFNPNSMMLTALKDMRK